MMRWFWLMLAVAAFVLVATCVVMPTKVRGHDGGEYMDWASENTGRCCSNEDCRPLTDKEWTEDNDGYSVRITPYLWCRVEKKHFLIRGRSPDMTRAHACIAPNLIECKNLLCFDPPAKF